MKRPPEPAAALWNLVTTDGTTARGLRIRPGWYRVDGGTPERMLAELARRQDYAASHGWAATLAVTERDATGRCPQPEALM